jgi:hypothetical protein
MKIAYDEFNRMQKKYRDNEVKNNFDFTPFSCSGGIF